MRKWKDISGTSGYELIVAQRSQFLSSIDLVTRQFGAKCIKTPKQLLLNNVFKGLSPRPITLNMNWFVEPAIELENGKTIQNTIDYLVKWFTKSSIDENKILVLTADGGLGKTTIARCLCEKIYKADNTVIPILIESEQWKNLVHSNITFDMLWNLAISRRFEHPTRLLSNEIALKALIQSGVFVVIFDGFDELCGSPSCGYKAQDIIDKLIELIATDEEYPQAKIMLTSRKTYLNSIIDEIQTDNLNIVRLKGFDNEQRKKYFNLRLSEKRCIDIANRISKQICGAMYDEIDVEIENEDRPSGVPFILDLIASYVDGNDDVNLNPYAGDQLESLLLDLCRRENVRQTLNIDPHKQFVFFEELFREYNDIISYDDIKLYLEYVCNISDPSVIQRFTSHSLLTRIEKDIFAPKYEVLRVYFVARFLANSLAEYGKKTERKHIAKLLSENSTGETQVMEWLVRQLKQMDENRRKNAFKHALEIIEDKENTDKYKLSYTAFFNLIRHFVSSDDKDERTHQLASYLGANKAGRIIFHRSVFNGIVKSYNFSDVKFNRCTFVDVDFKKCKFNSETEFNNCTFDGILSIDKCDGEESSIYQEDCVFSRESEIVMSKLNLNQ